MAGDTQHQRIEVEMRADAAIRQANDLIQKMKQLEKLQDRIARQVPSSNYTVNANSANKLNTANDDVIRTIRELNKNLSTLNAIKELIPESTVSRLEQVAKNVAKVSQSTNVGNISSDGMTISSYGNSKVFERISSYQKASGRASIDNAQSSKEISDTVNRVIRSNGGANESSLMKKLEKLIEQQQQKTYTNPRFTQSANEMNNYRQASNANSDLAAKIAVNQQKLNRHDSNYKYYSTTSKNLLNGIHNNVGNVEQDPSKIGGKYNGYDPKDFGGRARNVIERGNISYEGAQKFNASMEKHKSAFGKLNSDLASENESFSDTKKAIKDLDKEIHDRLEAINDELKSAGNDQEASRLKAQQEQLEQLLAQNSAQAQQASKISGTSFNRANDSTTNSRIQSGLKSEEQFNNNLGAYGVNVNPEKNSMAGYLYYRRYAIARSTVNGIAGTMASTAESGNQLRTSAYNSGVGSTMLQLGNNNYDFHGRPDSDIEGNLASLGRHNGTKYSTTDMAQLLGAYSTSNSSGNLSNYKSQVDKISQLARFSGMGIENASQLTSAMGNSGVTDMGGNAAVMSGALQRSNMVARSGVQAQALSSIFASNANVGVTNAEAGRTTAFQGLMAKQGSVLQGQQGAQSYMAMSGSLMNFNDPVSRLMFGGNSSKYAGIHGQAKLMEDMQDAKSDPSKLKDSIGNILKSTHGDEEVAAATLSQMTNGQVSVKQAKKYISMYKSGDFDKKHLDAEAKKDKSLSGKNDKGKETYGKSGQATIDLTITLKQDGQIAVSKSLDGSRNISTHIKNMLPDSIRGWGGVAMGAVGGLAQSMMSYGLGKLGMKGAGSLLKKFMGSSLGKKGMELLGKTKLGGKAVEWITKGLGSATEGAAESAAGKGVLSGIFKGATKLPLGKVAGALGVVGVGAGMLHKEQEIADNACSSVKDSKHDGLLTGITRNLFGDNVANGLSDFIFGTHRKDRDGKHSKGIIGNWFDDIFGGGSEAHADSVSDIKNSKKKKSKKHESSTKKRTDKKTSKFTDKQEDLLHYFDNLLDKAMKVVAEAKSINLQGKDGDSDSDVGDASGGGHKGDAKYWEDKIREVAKAMGQTVTDEQVKMISSMMKAESGYDETVTQKIQDVNSRNGNPAHGILQFIQPTFDKYKVSGHDNINSGVDQLYALFNDSNWQHDIHYGGGWGPTGTPIKHARGGLFSTATSLSNHVVGEDGLELALPMNSAHRLDSLNVLNKVAPMFGKQLVDTSSRTRGNFSVSPNYNVSVNVSGNADSNQVQQAVQNALEQTTARLQDSMLRYYTKMI